jgi:hypothetical protein
MTADLRAQLGIERNYRTAAQRTAELFPPRPRPQQVLLTRAGALRVAIWFVVFFELVLWPCLVVFAGASLMVFEIFVVLAPANLAISENNWRRARRLYLAPLEANPGRIRELETWQSTFNERLLVDGDAVAAEEQADFAVQKLRTPVYGGDNWLPRLMAKPIPDVRPTRTERPLQLMPNVATDGYESWCNACGEQTECFLTTYEGVAATLCPKCALVLTTAWRKIVLNGTTVSERRYQLKALLEAFGTRSAPKAEYGTSFARAAPTPRDRVSQIDIKRLAQKYTATADDVLRFQQQAVLKALGAKAVGAKPRSTGTR